MQLRWCRQSADTRFERYGLPHLEPYGSLRPDIESTSPVIASIASGARLVAVDLTGLPGAMDCWHKHSVFPPPAHNPLENVGRFPQPLGKPAAGFPQLHNRDDDDPQDSYVNGGIPSLL